MANKNRHKIVAVLAAFFFVFSFSISLFFFSLFRFLLFHDILEPQNSPANEVTGRKILGTPAGCPWDTRWDKQGPVSQGLLLFTIQKLTEKGPFCRETGRVSLARGF